MFISFLISLTLFLSETGSPVYITELYTSSIDTSHTATGAMITEVSLWTLAMLCQALTRLYVKLKISSTNTDGPSQELFSNKSLVLCFFLGIFPTVGSKLGFSRTYFKTFFLINKITLVPIQILLTHDKAREFFMNSHPKLKKCSEIVSRGFKKNQRGPNQDFDISISTISRPKSNIILANSRIHGQELSPNNSNWESSRSSRMNHSSEMNVIQLPRIDVY